MMIELRNFDTSNRVIIIIIINVIISLMGSHWLLSVSVLNMNLWFVWRVKDHWLLNKFLLGAQMGSPDICS